MDKKISQRKNRRKNQKINIRTIIVLLFILYMLLLFAVLVLKYPTGMLEGSLKKIISGESIARMEPKWIPFETIIDYASRAHVLQDWFVKNLACNVIMFLPFGFLLPWVSKLKGWRLILSGCLLSVAIEVLQYATALGQMDVDDVILNTLGTALGYGIYLLIVRYKNK